MKALRLLGSMTLIIAGFTQVPWCWSEEKPANPNPVLAERANALTKRSMVVLSENDGVAILSLPSEGQSVADKTQIIFFRKKRARMEVIANGTVSGERKNTKGIPELLVDIDRDTIIKYPQSGDYALPMADPNATAEGAKVDQFDYLVPEENKEKPENDRPGYLEAGVGLMFGTLSADPSSQANDDKKTSGYRFEDIHLAYFSDYFPLGVELDSHHGNFPTHTYQQTTVTSSESVSNISLDYRFHTLFHKHLAPILKVTSLSDQFTTDNTDENVLSTKVTGLGFGLRLNYDWVSPIWKPLKAKVGFAFQQVFAEFFYYPSLSAVDGIVSRGTSSVGSNGTQYRLGFTSLAYLGFVPLIKRFVLQGSIGARSYNLKFQGSTVGEAIANGYQIPQNSTSKEGESDYRFFVGIRIEDPIKLLFSGGDKKEEASK